MHPLSIITDSAERSRSLSTQLAGAFEPRLLDRRPSTDPITVPEAVSSGIDTLQGIFASACFGSGLDGESIDRANAAVISDIKSAGLAPWIDCVRKHPSQTYQHCLLVAGISV